MKEKLPRNLKNRCRAETVEKCSINRTWLIEGHFGDEIMSLALPYMVSAIPIWFGTLHIDIFILEKII